MASEIRAGTAPPPPAVIASPKVSEIRYVMKIQALSLFFDCFRMGQASQPTGEPGFACCGHLTSSTGSTNFSRRRSLVGQRPPPKVASLPLAIWVGAS